MNSIYAFELKRRWRSVMTWSLSLLALLMVFIALYPSFSAENEAMMAMLDSFPAEFKAIFGMTNLDLSKIEGYFGFTFVFIQLCVAIQAANYGFGLVSVEESEHTADFLLTRPVSRSTILWNKLLAAATGLILTDIIIAAASLALIRAFRGSEAVNYRPILLLLGSLPVFQLIFFSFGLFISILVGRVRNVTYWGLSLGFGLYMINGMGGMLGDVRLEAVSPFMHFSPSRLSLLGAWDWPLVVLDLVVILVALTLAHVLYLKRDVPTPA